MNPSHIEHIGIAVKNIDESIKLYENLLGIKCYKIENVEDQKVKTAFFKIGQTKIELLEATSEESPIAKYIEKKGEGLHHIAFAVSEIQEKLNSTKEKGYKLIDENPRPGADNMQIAFLHPKSTQSVLVELCENLK